MQIDIERLVSEPPSSAATCAHYLPNLQNAFGGGTVLQVSKQHLRIKRFYGNSTNAVKTHFWIAVCASS
jgi:hypothetical protein